MKRYGNLYPKIYDEENLLLAHRSARRGKGWYKEVQAVNANESAYLGLLHTHLVNKEYQTSKYKVYSLCENGKNRLIYKLPYYPDRIAQWALMLVIQPYLIRRFTKNTYSAIPGRGIHKAQTDMHRDIVADPIGTKYCLKMDITKFYPHIDHKILKKQYCQIFKDRDLLWLLDEIIDSTPSEVGIPIGNYISQYSANLYLTNFDHWVKEKLHVKYYYRYMDDMVFLASSKVFLHDVETQAIDYLTKLLKLPVKQNYQIFPTRIRGIDFLGYRDFGDFILLRKSTAKRFKQKMRKIREQINAGQPLSEKNKSVLSSYNGWLKYCDSFRLKNKYTRDIYAILAEREFQNESTRKNL